MGADRVNARGDLAFCPPDWVHGSYVADYRSTTIEQAWQSEFYRSLRSAHLTERLRAARVLRTVSRLGVHALARTGPQLRGYGQGVYRRGSLADVAGAQATSVAAHLEDGQTEVPGWTRSTSSCRSSSLAFASAHLGGDLLEIGSWCGRSGGGSRARGALRTGSTRVHCIDLVPRKRADWTQNPDGSYSMTGAELGQRGGRGVSRSRPYGKSPSNAISRRSTGSGRHPRHHSSRRSLQVLSSDMSS